MVTIPSLKAPLTIIPRAPKLGKTIHLKKVAKLGKKGANLEASPLEVWEEKITCHRSIDGNKTCHSSMGGKYDMPWGYWRKIRNVMEVWEENLTHHFSMGEKNDTL